MLSFVYIEDDAMSRKVMAMLLTKKMGYNSVTILEDSENFLAKILELPYPPDVIFLDIHMQPYNGFEVLEMIRAGGHCPEAKMVALTASVMNEEVELLRKAGFDGVIGKPIDINTFPDLLNRILQGERIWRPT